MNRRRASLKPSWTLDLALDHVTTPVMLSVNCTGFRLNSASHINSVSSCTPLSQAPHRNTSQTWLLSGRAHLRSAALGLYDVPRTRTLMGSKAFSVAGPTAWNSLPQSLCDISSAAAFKRHLKTHLFICAYQ